MTPIYRTTLVIVTTESVTPDYLALRLVQAAAKYGALRPGEGIESPSDPSKVIEITDQPVEFPDGWKPWKES